MMLFYDLSAITNPPLMEVQPESNLTMTEAHARGFLFNPGTREWVRLNSRTNAIIFASYAIHLPELTASSLPEWTYRLDLLYDSGISFLHVDTPEGKIPSPLTISDLLRHLRLKTSTPLWSPSRFDLHVRTIRMGALQKRLESLDDHLKDQPPASAP
jgi:hypothetical protein